MTLRLRGGGTVEFEKGEEAGGGLKGALVDSDPCRQENLLEPKIFVQ